MKFFLYKMQIKQYYYGFHKNFKNELGVYAHAHAHALALALAHALPMPLPSGHGQGHGKGMGKGKDMRAALPKGQGSTRPK